MDRKGAERTILVTRYGHRRKHVYMVNACGFIFLLNHKMLKQEEHRIYKLDPIPKELWERLIERKTSDRKKLIKKRIIEETLKKEPCPVILKGNAISKTILEAIEKIANPNGTTNKIQKKTGNKGVKVLPIRRSQALLKVVRKPLAVMRVS
jgi:hypothetical protein